MSQRTRIALTLVQCWHRVPGGTASSVLSLASELAQRDDLDIVGVGPWGRELPAAPWTPTVPIQRLPAPYQALYDLWQVAGVLTPERAVPGAQVVHATAATVPRRGSAPLVVTIHDLFPLSNPEYFTARGVRIMTRGVELARQRATVVCCPSTDTFDDCRAAGFSDAQLRLVPWGTTPHPVDEADRVRVRDRYRLDRPFILWVGTIEPRKNLTTLLDAYRSMQSSEPVDADLVLVGPVGWHEQLEGHIDGVGSRVRQLGFVPAADLSALYAEADVFCFPSIREGFGLPALDAMAQGTPVIASRDTAVHEVMGDTGVVVDALSVEAWAEAIRNMLSDNVRAKRIGELGRERSTEFTWSRCADQMADIYHEVAS